MAEGAWKVVWVDWRVLGVAGRLGGCRGLTGGRNRSERLLPGKCPHAKYAGSTRLGVVVEWQGVW